MLAVGIVIILLVLLLFLPLLFPIELWIDTTAGDFLLRWRGVGGARLTGTVDDPVLRWWVVGWRKEKHLLEFMGPSPAKKGKAAKKHRSGGSRRPRWLTRHLMVRVARTFQVNTFHLLLDTDDYVVNAFLFPLFHYFSGGGRQLTINFSGRNELVLNVSNRPGKVLWVIISQVVKP